MTPEQMLADWMEKARLVRSLRNGELIPAWSTGELLAVALLLGDDELLASMDYDYRGALERLRWDLRLDSVEDAADVFARARVHL